MEHVSLYITATNREEAMTIARELLGERLIACANVVDHVSSLYWWQGEIEQQPEAIIMAKTQNIHMDRITERVKKLHSHSTPCVIALPIISGNPDYLEWITRETTPRA